MKLEGILNSLEDKKDMASKKDFLKNLYTKRKDEYFDIFFSNILSSRKNLRYITPVE